MGDVLALQAQGRALREGGVVHLPAVVAVDDRPPLGTGGQADPHLALGHQGFHLGLPQQPPQVPGPGVAVLQGSRPALDIARALLVEPGLHRELCPRQQPHRRIVAAVHLGEEIAQEALGLGAQGAGAGAEVLDDELGVQPADLDRPAGALEHDAGVVRTGDRALDAGPALEQECPVALRIEVCIELRVPGDLHRSAGPVQLPGPEGPRRPGPAGPPVGDDVDDGVDEGGSLLGARGARARGEGCADAEDERHLTKYLLRP